MLPSLGKFIGFSYPILSWMGPTFFSDPPPTFTQTVDATGLTKCSGRFKDQNQLEMYYDATDGLLHYQAIV